MIVNFALLFGTSFAWAIGHLFIGASAGVPPISATALLTTMSAIVLLVVVRFVLRRNLTGLMREHGWVPMIMGLTAIGIPNLFSCQCRAPHYPESRGALGGDRADRAAPDHHLYYSGSSG